MLKYKLKIKNEDGGASKAVGFTMFWSPSTDESIADKTMGATGPSRIN